LRALPADGLLPGIGGWQWHHNHTPGHTDGHISLFRPADRLLIAGDALITTRQESALSVLTQRAELRPPPAYDTTDWDAAKASVEKLASLNPDILASAHGRPMRGEMLRRDLDALVTHFTRWTATIAIAAGLWWMWRARNRGIARSGGRRRSEAHIAVAA
jgi:glyoxylase-like metal-dependent hydrolase (beta-lactamase superfamily II)